MSSNPLESCINGCLSSCCCPDAGASRPDTGADKSALSASSFKKRCHDAAFRGEDHNGDRKLQHEDDGNNGGSIASLEATPLQTAISNAINAEIASLARLAAGNDPENGAAQLVAPDVTKQSVVILKNWFSLNHNNISPSKDEINTLKIMTGIDLKRLKKLFVSLRKTAKKAKRAVQLEEAAQRVAAREEEKARKIAVQLEEAAQEVARKEEEKARKRAVQLEEAAQRAAAREEAAQRAAAREEEKARKIAAIEAEIAKIAEVEGAKEGQGIQKWVNVTLFAEAAQEFANKLFQQIRMQKQKQTLDKVVEFWPREDKEDEVRSLVMSLKRGELSIKTSCITDYVRFQMCTAQSFPGLDKDLHFWKVKRRIYSIIGAKETRVVFGRSITRTRASKEDFITKMYNLTGCMETARNRANDLYAQT